MEIINQIRNLLPGQSIVYGQAKVTGWMDWEMRKAMAPLYDGGEYDFVQRRSTAIPDGKVGVFDYIVTRRHKRDKYRAMRRVEMKLDGLNH